MPDRAIILSTRPGRNLAQPSLVGSSASPGAADAGVQARRHRDLPAPAFLDKGQSRRPAPASAFAPAPGPGRKIASAGSCISHHPECNPSPPPAAPGNAIGLYAGGTTRPPARQCSASSTRAVRHLRLVSQAPGSVCARRSRPIPIHADPGASTFHARRGRNAAKTPCSTRSSAGAPRWPPSGGLLERSARSAAGAVVQAGSGSVTDQLSPSASAGRGALHIPDAGGGSPHLREAGAGGVHPEPDPVQ